MISSGVNSEIEALAGQPVNLHTGSGIEALAGCAPPKIQSYLGGIAAKACTPISLHSGFESRKTRAAG